jgi:hypothetical protein
MDGQDITTSQVRAFLWGTHARLLQEVNMIISIITFFVG